MPFALDPFLIFVLRLLPPRTPPLAMFVAHPGSSAPFLWRCYAALALSREIRSTRREGGGGKYWQKQAYLEKEKRVGKGTSSFLKDFPLFEYLSSCIGSEEQELKLARVREAPAGTEREVHSQQH